MPCVCSDGRSEMKSKCSKNKNLGHEAIAECVTDVITTSKKRTKLKKAKVRSVDFKDINQNPIHETQSYFSLPRRRSKACHAFDKPEYICVGELLF